MHKVTIDEAKVQLPDLIKEAIYGEDVIITKENIPVVKLIPVPREIPKPQFGNAKGLITISEDFDEPLEDFRDYMQ
jgi:prevent-host-death family protein